MITNLFTIFDPSSFLIVNWITIIVPILYLLPYWNSKRKTTTIMNNLQSQIIEEIKTIIKPFHLKINILICLSIIIIILFINIIRVIPYIFNPTSHISVNLTLSLVIWSSIMIIGWLKYYKSILTHLVPQSTPPILIPVIVIIEIIRNLIRPITLSIRLTANIVAGHLLITLIGNQITTNITSLLITLPQTLLIILEMRVGAIQAYVFTILSTLYLGEISK